MIKFLIPLLFCCSLQAQITISGSTICGATIGIAGPAGPCTPAYAPPLGTGNRTNTIVVTSHSIVGSLLNPSGLEYKLVDGDFSNTDKPSFQSRDLSDGVEWINFNLGSQSTCTEITLYLSGSQDEGTWKWQGSNDGSSYTDIGGSFAWTGAATFVVTTLSGNTTAYQHYRMIGVSGNSNGNPFFRQVEFKTCP